ncbi:MAG: GspH/FimT family protein [Gammaproteobacteria bacterium]|jgi:type IV fimbrial biogenesis protein FimT
MEDHRRSGLTLVELLVTLTLLAILVGLAAPAMAVFVDRARLRSATQALAQELRQARDHAISHRKTVYFSISARTDRWCYGWRDDAPCRCDSPAPSAQCRSAEDGPLQTQSVTDFPGVQLLASRRAATRGVRFSPIRGTATGATFRLRSRHGEARVILSPLGRVRVCSPSDGAAAPC